MMLAPEGPISLNRLKRWFTISCIIAAAFMCLCAAALGTPAQAHRQKMGLTEISVNTETGMLEVAHQFNTHDAEHAAQQKFKTTRGILSDSKVRDAFAAYVAENFGLVSSQREIALTLLGSEIEGSRLWVYQEAQAPPQGPLTVTMTVMHDIWPGHVNLVNFRANSTTVSLLFEAGDGAKTLTMP